MVSSLHEYHAAFQDSTPDLVRVDSLPGRHLVEEFGYLPIDGRINDRFHASYFIPLADVTVKGWPGSPGRKGNPHPCPR